MIRGHYFRLSPTAFQRLCSSNFCQDELILWIHKGGELQPEDYQKGYEDYFNIDCFWQAIGFLLTGEANPLPKDYPISDFLYGGGFIGNYEPAATYGPLRYFKPPAVAETSRLLNNFDPSRLLDRFNPRIMDEYYINPCHWLDMPDVEDLKFDIQDYYSELCILFHNASQTESYVVTFLIWEG